MVKVRTAALALATATLVAYTPVLGATFVNYDDFDYVTKNPVVPGGLTIPGIRWAFTTGHMANWHPVAWISHMLDVTAFGLNPTGHHLTSLVLHVASTLLLARLLLEATGAPWRSLAVAALFALHPLHVESVAWIAERKDVLCTLFWFLTVIAWVRWTRSRSAKTYGIVVVLFALALGSKPMAVTLPCTLLLFDVWPLGRMRVFGIGGVPARADLPAPAQIGYGPALLEKAPLFLLAGLASVATYLVQQGGGAMDVAQPMSMPARIANAFVSYARYVGKTLAPIDLAIIYPHRIGGWPPLIVFLAVLGFAAVSIATLRLGRRHPWLPVGWFFYVGVLVPTIGLVQVGEASMADRYTYVPIIGLFIIGVWALGDALGGGAEKNKTMASAAAVTLIAACGALTFRQAGYFTDGITLFRHAILVTTPNVVANSQLGSALLKEHRLEEAGAAYRAAIAVAPKNPLPYTYLGAVLAQEGKIDEAIVQQEKALELDPNCPMAHYHLGLALLKLRQVSRAIKHFERAVALAPEAHHTHTGLGFGLSDANRFDAAMAEFREAIRLSPYGSIDARDGLGVALAGAGRPGEAIPIFTQVIALDPSRASTHANLGNALADSGRLDAGIAELELAARLDPGSAMTRYGLAIALLTSKRLPEAITQYREAARLDPKSIDAREGLGVALARAGRLGEAIPVFTQVVALDPSRASAHANLGNALTESGQLDAGRAELELAARLDPGNASK